MKNIMLNYLRILKDIKSFMPRFIKYQIMAKILIIIIFLPLIKLSLSFLMQKSGFELITNGDLAKFGLSLGGALGIVIILLSAIFIVLIQLGGLIVVCHQCNIKNKESGFLQIFKFLLPKLKRLLGVGSLIVIISMLITSSFVSDGFGTELARLQIPGFIKDHILNNFYLNILFKIVTILGILLAILSSFSLHIVILEDTSVTTAIKKSFRLVTKNAKLFVREILEIILVIALFAIITISIYSLLSLGIYYIVGDGIKELVFVIELIGLMLLLLSMEIISLPIGLMHFTEFYYKINGKIPNIKIASKKSGKIKRFISAVAFVLICLLISVSYLMQDLIGVNGEIDLKVNTKITAHRGSSIEAPENTISALKLAINNKADFCEFDVQEAMDGSLVVTHDSNFKRISNVDKNIWEMNLKEIQALDVGSSFSEKFKGEKIPTLEEFIDVAGENIRLNIEIKTHGHEKNLVASVVKMIEKKNLINSCVVTSLNYDVLQEVEKLNPKIKTGYITFVVLGDFEKLNVDFYSVEETNVNSDFIYKAHKLGKEVHAWTINKEDSIAKMINLKVDNIITDNDAVAVLIKNDESETREILNEFFTKGIKPILERINIFN